MTLVIGIHGWRIGYLPRFSQTEVLSDILWLVCVGALCVSVCCISMFGASFVFTSYMPGSAIEEPKRSNARQLAIPELFLLALLCIAAAPLPALVAAPGVDPELRGQTIFTAVTIYSAMLVHTLFTLGGVRRGALGKDIVDLLKKQGWKSLAFRRELSGAISYGFALAFFCFASYLLSGKVGSVLVIAASLFWPQIAALSPVLLTLAGLIAFRLFYYMDASSQAIAAVVLPIVLLFSLTILGPLILSVARIGNLTNSTVLVDSKFSPVLQELGSLERKGEHLVSAKADVVLAFGADVILAAPGSFGATSTCAFSSSARTAAGPKDVNRAGAHREVWCIAIPRSAIYSLM